VVESNATYDVLDTLVEDGLIAAYGLSVETVEQARAAVARPHVSTVQIILKAFRLRPLDTVLPEAEAAGVGIIARVPLASGLLSGRHDLDTTFAPDDHRSYNRDGSAFDVGETFSGVDYATGVAAARAFSELVADSGLTGVTPTQVAIAWVWQQPGVSTVIPGARDVAQARTNAAAGKLAALPPELLASIVELYDTRIRSQVHVRW
jgi:aryl-alcohol dehydrogenase-like predicted oxidoreductase